MSNRTHQLDLVVRAASGDHVTHIQRLVAASQDEAAERRRDDINRRALVHEWSRAMQRQESANESLLELLDAQQTGNDHLEELSVQLEVVEGGLQYAGSQLNSLRADFGQFGEQLDAGLEGVRSEVASLAERLAQSLRAQTDALLAGQRAEFADQRAWQQHESSYAFRACKVLAAVTLLRREAAFQAEAEAWCTAVTRPWRAVIERYQTAMAGSFAARKALEAQAAPTAPALNPFCTSSDQGADAGIIEWSDPSTHGTPKWIARVSDALECRSQAKLETDFDNRLRAALALTPPMLPAEVPPIDFELARALEEAGATEYPGLGAIPLKTELPNLLMELRALQVAPKPILSAPRYLEFRELALERVNAFLSPDFNQFMSEYGWMVDMSSE